MSQRAYSNPVMTEQKVNAYTGYLEELEKPIDYKYYFFLFKKNFYVIFTFFIIAVTLAAVYTAKMPERFQSTAQLIIEKPQAAGTESKTQGAGTGEGPQGESEDYYNTQMEIMQSPSVLGEVVNELKLTDYFEIENEEQAVTELLKMLRVERIGTSRLFNIRVVAEDGQVAASIANSIARAYIRKNFENMLYYSKEVLSWMPQEGKTDDKISVTDPSGAVKQLTRQELIESLPAIQTDATIRELREKKSFLEAEIKTLLRQYREKHPVIIKARANLKYLEDSIDTEKSRILQNLKSEAEGRHQAEHARLLEEAKPPKEPLPSKRLQIILIVGLLELALSFGLIALLDHFDDTIRCLEDFERKSLVLPFLGPIPLVKGKAIDQSSAKALAHFYKKNSEVAESFRYLRVAINFSATPESLKTLVFTSCLPHEGKSFISRNIAISFAMDGNKTLLVDADLRRPVLHDHFKVDNGVGLSNFLTSNIELDSVIKESFVENLSLITSGPVSPNPGEILGSERMKLFLTEARKRFDRVIIDCPPLTGIGDGYVVGHLMGQLIMVIASGKTPVDLVKHTQRQLEKADIKIIGVILSMVDLDKERYSGYTKHYYHTYTRYYQT